MTTRLLYGMIPYNREEGDIYSGLCFNPDEKEPLPDAMYQETVLLETMYLLSARFNASNAHGNVFLSSNTFICYDRSNLNIRVALIATSPLAWTPPPFGRGGCICLGKRARCPTSPWK